MSETVVTNKPTEHPAASTAVIAGRGTIYITAAKAWFMVSGYAIHFSLPRLISAEQFGLYQVVISVVSVVNAVLVLGASQAVSKYVSQEPAKATAIKAAALRTQVIVGFTVSIGFFLLAPVLANRMNDSRLSGFFRLSSAIPLFYSFYGVFTGYFNGKKQFVKQAFLDMTYSTLKAVLVVLLTWLGYGVWGGVGGFALASGSTLAIAYLAARNDGSGEKMAVTGLFTFQFYLLASTLIINLLQKTDLILVKAVSASDPGAAAVNAGYYGAAVNVANITFQIIVSITFVIFPLVSEATFKREIETTRVYVTNTLRAVLIIMVPVATVLSANAGSILGLLYPADYKGAGPALRILAFGALLFGLLYVTTTVITAGGRPLVTLALAGVSLGANAAFGFAWIPTHGLPGAAAAVVISMMLGAIGSLIYLTLKYGWIVPVATVIRLAGCAGIIYGMSLAIRPETKLLLLGKLAILAVVFTVLLVISKEIKRSDLTAFRGIIRI